MTVRQVQMNNDTLKNNPHVSRADLSALHQDLCQWAYSLVGAHAEDVLQHTYVLILEGKARYDRQSTLKTWTFGVVRNVSRDLARRAERQRVGVAQLAVLDGQAVADDRTESGPNADRRAQMIDAAMAALSAQQREVLQLHTYREFSLSECADIMNLSLGTVRTHYHRAKAALKEQLEDIHAEAE